MDNYKGDKMLNNVDYSSVPEFGLKTENNDSLNMEMNVGH